MFSNVKKNIEAGSPWAKPPVEGVVKTKDGKKADYNTLVSLQYNILAHTGKAGTVVSLSDIARDHNMSQTEVQAYKQRLANS
jgi:hypothetical protein